MLHTFTGDVSDGIFPPSGLIGGIYGTTSEGGEWDRGTLYAMSPSGEETVVLSFLISDMGYTPNGNLVAYGGILYGTTFYAAYPPCDCGAVYGLSGSNLTLLYDFNGTPDGAYPNGYLVVGNRGHL